MKIIKVVYHMADAVIYDCIVLYEQNREQLNFRVSIMADSTHDMAEQIQIHMESF
jgi:hypothetical protein